MSWKEYFLAAVIVNIFQMAIAFTIFSLQGVLPLNPQGFPGLSWDLAFMQVVSFATNTNLQHYNGEGNCIQLPNCSNLTGVPGLSYLSQMMAVQFLQFTSAATGISVAIAMIRGFIAHSKGMGNFYVDFTRSLTRILLPLCFVASLVFVGLGVPQTLTGYQVVTTVEGATTRATQAILVGPVLPKQSWWAQSLRLSVSCSWAQMGEVTLARTQLIHSKTRILHLTSSRSSSCY